MDSSQIACGSRFPVHLKRHKSEANGRRISLNPFKTRRIGTILHHVASLLQLAASGFIATSGFESPHGEPELQPSLIPPAIPAVHKLHSENRLFPRQGPLTLSTSGWFAPCLLQLTLRHSPLSAVSPLAQQAPPQQSEIEAEFSSESASIRQQRWPSACLE